MQRHNNNKYSQSPSPRCFFSVSVVLFKSIEVALFGLQLLTFALPRCGWPVSFFGLSMSLKNATCNIKLI